MISKRLTFECTLQPGIIENLDFLLKSRAIINRYYNGKCKNLKTNFEYFEGEERISADITDPMLEYLSILTEVIDQALQRIEEEISVGRGYIKNLLEEKNSYLVIKLHLIIQCLLWSYIKNKVGKLPKQYENWNFNQIVDLADAFEEIPVEVISYINSLNTLRNNVAHRPFAFEFANIKRKYSTALYAKGGVLFGVSGVPHSEEDVFEDWKTTFLICAIVLGYLINKGLYNPGVATKHNFSLQVEGS